MRLAFLFLSVTDFGIAHPNSTGLGWVDGTGLGHLDTRLDTVDHRPNTHTRLASVGWMGWARNTHTRQASVGRMGRAWDNNTPHTTQLINIPGPKVGWQGRAWVIYTYFLTQHSATTLLARGRVEGTGLGQQSTTRQHNTDSYGSGLMVGWMGRAWKTLLYILTPIYDTARQHFWPHGWVDGMGLEDHIIYTCSVLTQGLTASAKSQALVGWQGRAWDIRRNLAVDIGHKAVSYQLPHLGMTDFTSTTNQALVGWQGWAWVVARRHRLSTRSLSEPRRGWLVGTGWVTSVTRHWASSEPGPALVSWLAQAGSPDSTSNTHEPGLGWAVGKGLGHRTRGVEGLDQVLPLQQPKPWMGGRDGLGLSDSTSIIQVHCSGEPQALDGWLGRAWDNNSPHTTQFTAVVNQALVGWKGRAWDLLTLTAKVHCSGEPGLGGWQGRAWDIGHGRGGGELPDKTPCPGWVDGKGLGYRLTTTAQFTTAVDQASDGRLGRAWDIGSNILHTASLPSHQWFLDSMPWLGGRDGPGSSHTGRGALGCHASKNQASVGRLGRAWDIGHGGGGVLLWWSMITHRLIVSWDTHCNGKLSV
ncbi:uncharacterized protein BO87DRAFT_417425 [Aspergillus neoniger CBS 115656]|uniref:G-patch domain-containing protein n=1 Tax=Aspergillus neoniger (strain CBS 115656) TaxID=1448310 RepID=A0A318YE52_ASPNB|nr:hypothetical protein BO87DRAFT_417425 [Aspergillus neoniger CBS 115656]PYH32389.1 hypothetical protein BO87DRAFT_417425 [Aspergillus neoniger CBS 115656]